MSTRGNPASAPEPTTAKTPPHATAAPTGHPPGLYLLFVTEMWERFSYYGMRGLLVLYLIGTFSVRELPIGTFTNDLEITQIQSVEKPDPKRPGKTISEDVDGPSRLQTITIAIGQQASGGATETAPGFALAVERVKSTEVDDPGKPGKKRPAWVPANIEANAPVVVTGTPGAKVFENESFAFRITNPTGKPIKIRTGIKRSEKEPRPYFIVDQSSTPVVTEIKPDADLDQTKFGTPDDPRYVLRVATNPVSSGRFWTRADASTLYGWYTGLAYLLPLLGGLIADKLIGTHRSMLVGGLLIAAGHIVLAISGLGGMASSPQGMSVFIFGLALIVLGTGHFKPTVSVMVGQLYGPDDPRRDSAFTIFYMGINLGAFICAFVCGTLGEKVGWHWGFGSAAIGMLAGLFAYMLGRPKLLQGIGLPPSGKPNYAPLFLLSSVVLAAVFALAYHQGFFGWLGTSTGKLFADDTRKRLLLVALSALVVGASIWFVAIQNRGDKGPTASILIFIVFNAFFWLAFEQAGSSLNLFAAERTDRNLLGWEMPATWFQSVNPFLIIALAPLFAGLWSYLGRRDLNPSQPLKIAYGLLLLGAGYVFMVAGGKFAATGMKVSMFWLLATYTLHTFGELCLSPTGLSYVTRAAPVRFVSFLMGLWFISSFIANLGAGIVASYVEDIEQGKLDLFWYPWFKLGGQADYYLLFVISSVGAGLLILILTPALKKLIRPGT